MTNGDGAAVARWTSLTFLFDGGDHPRRKKLKDAQRFGGRESGLQFQPRLINCHQFHCIATTERALNFSWRGSVRRALFARQKRSIARRVPVLIFCQSNTQTCIFPTNIKFVKFTDFGPYLTYWNEHHAAGFAPKCDEKTITMTTYSKLNDQHLVTPGAPIMTFGQPMMMTPGATVLPFNPLDEKQKWPYRNSFEPFLFRLITLGILGSFYLLYIICIFALGPILSASDRSTGPVIGIAIGASVPVLFCISVLAYFWKPDMWIRVDRLVMELQITKTRSGGYCAHGPHIRVPLASIQNVVATQAGGCGSCIGRTFTIDVILVDGSPLRLTPLTDLTQTRAFTEANKIINAVRLCRGEQLVIAV